ncbi:MAG: hypothetical protein IPK88_07930 [Saprospiraceae bacterium]|nr:hypothetical protein [Candidatus Defluviibacterium haderslevense]
MKPYLKELKEFFESTFAHVKTYILIEVIFIIVFGVASSQVKELLSAWTLLIVVSGIVFFITYLERYKFLKKFPISLIESVEQSLELKDIEIERRKSEIENIKINKSKERSSLINDSISDTIVGLNDQTCTLSSKEDTIDEIANKLCDKDVEDGLIQILSPFISEVYTIIQGENSQITVGVYFQKIAQDDWIEKSLPPENPMLIVIKDDNEIKDYIPIDLVENPTMIGDKQILQQHVETCLRNNRYVSSQIDFCGSNFNLVVSPIPYACDENRPSGAMIILLKNNEFPKDFEKIVKIFNRLLTNWMYKYNSCVFNRNSEVYLEFDLSKEGDVNNKIILYNNGRYKITNPTHLVQEVNN